MNNSLPQYSYWVPSTSATKRFRGDDQKSGEDDSIQTMVKRMRVNDSLPSSPQRFQNTQSNYQPTNSFQSNDVHEIPHPFHVASQQTPNYNSTPLLSGPSFQTAATSQYNSETAMVRRYSNMDSSDARMMSPRELRQLQFRQQEEGRHSSLLLQQTPGQESIERGGIPLTPSYAMNSLLGSLHQERRRERVNQRVLLPTDSQLF
jgi:hypothetical protein